MFRKNETAGQEWSRESMVACANRQDELLETTSRLVRPGGVLVYSTCTFNPLENERVITNFLKNTPGFVLEKPVEFPGSQTGRPEWAEGYLDAPKLTDTLRLWPHRVTGEGHFIARLRRENTLGDAQVKLPGFRVNKPNREMVRLFKAFTQSRLLNLDDLPGVNLFQFPGSAAGNLSQEGTYLYWLHPELPDLSGLRVVHPGWWLGTFKKARFEPSHALALGLRTDQVRQVVNLPAQSADVLNYLRGQGLDQPGADGWVLVCVEGFPLGWGKRLNGTVKNFYPKGLRWS
jgi:NOL1/NOP2/fmu family ribosome biogenesis protein